MAMPDCFDSNCFLELSLLMKMMMDKHYSYNVFPDAGHSNCRSLISNSFHGDTIYEPCDYNCFSGWGIFLGSYYCYFV
jgi:hypothetical protein